jgi:hypothetical protein
LPAIVASHTLIPEALRVADALGIGRDHASPAESHCS